MTLAELESMQFVLQEGFAAIDSSPYVVQQRASIIKAVADAIEALLSRDREKALAVIRGDLDVNGDPIWSLEEWGSFARAFEHCQNWLPDLIWRPAKASIAARRFDTTS